MMTQQELYRYKLTQGARAAADLLLLVGPDDFDGDYIVDLDITKHGDDLSEEIEKVA